jgi:hypothetical protein
LLVSQLPRRAGVELGSSGKVLAAKNAAAAAARDAALCETLAPMVGMSSRAIAQRLTELGIEPPRGGAWSYQTVLRMMARLGIQKTAA